MAVARVTSLRGAMQRGFVLLAAGCVALPSAALAATGGAGLPGGGMPGPSVSSEPLVEPASPQTGMASSDTASQVTLTRPTAALPVLATQSRRPEDPVTRDLAALMEPSPIAAIDGHVVYVRQHMGHTELVDVGDPARPRILLAGTREFGPPSTGRDERGHPVVVISPCAGTEEVLMAGEDPRCPLRAVDLTDGTSRALSATTGALAGDMHGTRVVFTRRGGPSGTRLYRTTGSTAKALPLPRLGRTGDGWRPADGKPVPGSVRIGDLDVGPDGRIAAVIEYRAKKPAYSSSLWLHSASGKWKRLTTLRTSYTGQGTRQVFAPSLDDGGVRAYVEGIVDGPSFVGRWTDSGKRTTKLSLRRSIGRTTILHGAAYDGDRLVFVDWLPGVPCGSEEALACGLRAAGPLPAG